MSLLLNGGDFDTIASYAPNSRPDSAVTIPIGGQADFQVEAMSGTALKNVVVPFSPWVFNGTESGWSTIQTITLNEADAATVTTEPSAPTPVLTPTPIASTPAELTSTSPSPTVAPMQPGTQTGLFGFSWEQTAIIVLIVMVAVLLVVVGMLLRKRTAK